MKNLLPWQSIIMNVAATGTVIAYARFIFLSHNQQEKVNSNIWVPAIFLISALVATNIFYPGAYTVGNIVKALAIIGIGCLSYFFVFKRSFVKLPRVLERFENLVGFMGLTLILLFWMRFAV
jgi:multicomponent Na+:H+ antiporter subunit D